MKIEITQFPDGFHHKTIPWSAAHTCCLGQIKESSSIPSTPTPPPHPPSPEFRYHLENHTHHCNMPSGHILMCLFYVPSLVPDYCLKCVTQTLNQYHYHAQPMRFGSRGPRQFSRPFVSDTSPKCIDREGPERRRTGTRQVAENRSLPQCMWDTLNLPKKLTY